ARPRSGGRHRAGPRARRGRLRHRFLSDGSVGRVRHPLSKAIDRDAAPRKRQRVRVTFDPTFDATPWPGPLTDRDASAGEAWAGPRFLLNLLETQLGLGGPVVPAALRAATLVPALRATAGFWSDSAEVD